LCWRSIYQDYRFALADFFLKRALSLLHLCHLLWTIPDDSVSASGTGLERGQPGPRAVGVLLVLWVLTALLYRGSCIGFIDRFVDKVVLRRSDYGELRTFGTVALVVRDSCLLSSMK